MIDIHSHILYGLDDGSRTLEESVAMVRMAGDAGTTDIVATPHANLQYRFDPELVKQRIAELQKAAGAVPRIHYGCDFHLSYDNLQDAIAYPGKYSINHLGYLLVEFSEVAIFHTTSEILERLLNAGLVPIITHPERNSLLQQRLKELHGWVEMGCLLQVTGQSLLGRFGQRACRFAEELVKRNLAHFVASDAHDLRRRPPVLAEASKHLRDGYGEAVARRLLADNPQAALEGRPLEAAPATPPERQRKWYGFWA